MREKLLIGQKTDNEEQCKDAKIALAMRQVEYKDAIIVLAAKQENARLHVSVVLVSMQRCHHCFGWTETTLQIHCTENRNKYSQKRNCAASFPSSSIYSHDRYTYFATKQADRSWEYVNRSQIHECRNWKWGCPVSFLGIHKSDLLSSVFRLKPLHLSGRGKNQEKCKDATGALEKTNPWIWSLIYKASRLQGYNHWYSSGRICEGCNQVTLVGWVEVEGCQLWGAASRLRRPPSPPVISVVKRWKVGPSGLSAPPPPHPMSPPAHTPPPSPKAIKEKKWGGNMAERDVLVNKLETTLKIKQA